MTLFSFEVPLKHLEEFDEYQDYYFALSFLCRESKEYFEYIKDKVNLGHSVILDNSYNELNKPDSPKELAEMFYKLGNIKMIDGVVSPDSDKWSFEELKEAYKEMISLVPKERVWVVVRNEKEWLHFGQETKCCSTFLHRPTNSKLYFCSHYLGLVDPLEIVLFKPETCDTSMPIKIALKGMNMNDWRLEGFPHYHTREWTDPSFFDLELTDKQLEQAKENIKWIKAGVKNAP